MPRKKVDWPAIQKLFEQTDMSVAAMSRMHDVSRAAIDKRSRTGGWKISPDREELMAKAIGGSVGAVGKVEPEVSDDSHQPVEISPKAWVRARELYEGTRMPLPAIARTVGIFEVDLDFKIADQGWSRFGVRRAQPSGLSEYRDGAMRDTATGATALERQPHGGALRRGKVEPEPVEPPPPRVDLRRVRAPKRAISARDKPPVEFNRARKLKASALADMGKDAAMAYMAQLRDLIGNQDIVNDMLNEWNEDHAEDDPFPTAKFETLEMLTNLKELGLMLKSAGAAYRAFCEGDGAVGKKERANETAAELAASSPFAQQPPPPRLAAKGGERV